MIDFTPIHNDEMKLLEFGRQFSVDDLRRVTNELYDATLEILGEADDAQMTFVPNDPSADDPYAVEGEQHIGWSLAHLVVHITASNEEGAAFASLAARGISLSGRLRYETNWHTVTTRAQVVQRLKESRRIMLAYLDTWPDEPLLDVMRDLSPRFVAKRGDLNAPASYLFGLMHHEGHLDQFREVARQAREAASQIAETK